MSKRFLSDRDFVKEYEKATNIPDMVTEDTRYLFCFVIFLGIISYFTPSSDIRILAIILFFLILYFFLLYILIKVRLGELNIQQIKIDIQQYKAAKKREKTFLTDIGMSMKEATRRYNFILKEAFYVQSLQEVCKLNPHTRSGQKELIMNWYKFKDSSLVEYLLNNEYKETDFNIYAGHFGVNEPSEKKGFANLLFKLAILEDGIHNDEWNTIMTILPKLNFNDNYIDFVFKKRYGPLRTESEYSSNNESTSTGEKNVNLLKPYYDLLGLEVGASDEEIKKAYHNLALQHHPDMKKNAGRTKECEEMMAKINEAVEKIRG